MTHHQLIAFQFDGLRSMEDRMNVMHYTIPTKFSHKSRPWFKDITDKSLPRQLQIICCRSMKLINWKQITLHGLFTQSLNSDRSRPSMLL